MAKRKAIDLAEYIKGLPGLDDASKQLISEKLAASPEAAKRLTDELMTVPEFQSQMADLDRRSKEATDAQKKADDLRAANEKWYNENIGSGFQDQLKMQLADASGRLAAYQQTYGDIPGVTPLVSPAAPPPAGISQKQFDEALAKMRAENQDWAAGMFATAMPLAIDHYKRYGEALDVQGLIKTAIDLKNQPSSPLQTAYDFMTREKREAANAEAQKKRDDQLKKDWERDYKSRQGNPQTDRPEGQSVFHLAVNQPAEKKQEPVNSTVAESNRLKSFQQIWRQTSDELEKKEQAVA